MTARHRPQRTCVACGRRADQHLLLRLALHQGKVEPDPARRLPGRGAYICRQGECAQALASGRHRARAFGKTLGEDAWLGFLDSPPIMALPAKNMSY